MNRAFLKEFVLLFISSVIVNAIPYFLGFFTIGMWIYMSFGLVLVHYFGRWCETKYGKRK